MEGERREREEEMEKQEIVRKERVWEEAVES